MNFVYISPHFPKNFHLFCKALKNRGVTVLGISDVYTDCLEYQVRESLTDHYRVSSLGNFDELCNAMNYFIAKYGHIDFIESNNEFWLDNDARLRSIYNVTTGPLPSEIRIFNHKSLMKEKYQKANVKVARYHMVTSIEESMMFIEKVGYPVIVKPDHGVGASRTYKIENDEQLTNFFNTKDGEQYIMEEFVEGELISLDGVCNSKSEIVYPTHHVFPVPIMEIVNNIREVEYYTNKTIPNDLLEVASRVIKSFGAKSRFFHLEFFRLTKDKEGLGKKGDIVGLEVNMRVPGGYTTDMIDFAYGIDIYQIWADVIVYDENREPINSDKQYCLYIGRRDEITYVNNYDKIKEKYGTYVVSHDRMPDIFSSAMGNEYYMFRIPSLELISEIRQFVLSK